MNDDEFMQLVHKYRDEPAAPLVFEPAIEILIDSAHCDWLNKNIHQSGAKWERMIAVPDLWSQLPNERGLYMFVWRPRLALTFAAAPMEERFCWVLYVGRAGEKDAKKDTIRHRYQQEYSKYVGQNATCLWDVAPAEKREERLSRYLTLRPLEYWFLTLDDVRDIEVLERKLIRMLRPPLNQQHGRKLRPGKAVPAF
jgi:hypothetical protein